MTTIFTFRLLMFNVFIISHKKKFFIKKDGTYVMNTGELKGMPKGTYKVCIGGFKPTIESFPPPPGGGHPPRPRVIPPVIPVDKKFLDSAKSGLTCEVNGRTKYDITVEAPPAN